MKSTQQNKIKIGFTTRSSLKAGNYHENCWLDENIGEAYGFNDERCSNSPLELRLCTGNPTCNNGQANGENCACL